MQEVTLSKLNSSLEQLRRYLEAEKFKGYDPYDILNSPINFSLLGKWGPILAIQAQKRMPLNWRPLLGVKKGYNPKAIGLLLDAYSKAYMDKPTENALTQMKWLFHWLEENHSKTKSGIGWGYNFDWASPSKFLPAYSPSIVVTVFAAKGLFSYYEATKDEKVMALLSKVTGFILGDLERTEDETGICFSYTTVSKDCCYNASLLGAEYFARLYAITQNNEHKEWAQRAVGFALERQHADGKWNYSIDLSTGKEKRQVDFHQGYVLDAIALVKELTLPEDVARYNDALRKGMAFYREQQFFSSGQSKWRVPTVWPVEIHNQSQGILTLTRMASWDDRNLPFARTIANWTIDHMQDKQGFFYYKKYPAYTIKVPYMRWAQAWMFLALTELRLAMQGAKQPQDEHHNLNELDQ